METNRDVQKCKKQRHAGSAEAVLWNQIEVRRQQEISSQVVFTYIWPLVYRVSQEERARLGEGVPYVKVYRYNPKHLYPKLNGYGDNGQRKVGASCGSKYCNLHS